MDNFSESLQEFLLYDYSHNEVQEDLINVENMISSDDKKEYNNDSVFDLKQSLYDVEDIPILQKTSNDETGNEYTEEILAIKTKQFIPCIIINNDYREIQCCNRESVKG
ncbi:33810_t:CDS:2, partial [Gigaspora margarita]